MNVGSVAARDGNIMAIRHLSMMVHGFRLFVELLVEKGLASAARPLAGF